LRRKPVQLYGTHCGLSLQVRFIPSCRYAYHNLLTPCRSSWSSFVKQQTHHLGIALESNGDEEGGYSYTQLTEIWAAANATKSDVIMLWWSPDSLYQTYIGTDAEFTHVILPPPTQECFDARVDPADRCNGDLQLQIGEAEGACDTAPQALQKVIGKGLREISHQQGVNEVLWSPALDAVMNYEISDLQLGQIFNYWLERGVDKWNYDPREATCRWVVENLDLIQSFVPPSYPRVVVEEDFMGSSLFKASLFKASVVAACLATALIIVFLILVHLRRKTKVMFYAQVEFVYLILGGLMLVALGALAMAVPPSNTTCALVIWVMNLGYSVELPPLALKIDTINRLATSGRHMERVRLTNKKLFGSVIAVSVAVVGFLLLWTLMDIPQSELEYLLTEEKTESDETVIAAISHCASDSQLWLFVSVGWQAALLLYALVLGFMVSRVREDINDTNNLTILVFSQCFFAVLRIIVFLVAGSTDPAHMWSYQSIILSLDCIVAAMVFTLPKVFDKTSGDHESDEVLPDLFLETVRFQMWT
jgi:hypothetical protein